MPRVVALRVPWFAAAAQCRREPALVGQPLVLGAPKQGAWRVAALSEAAAAAGVRVGMPLAQAESLCPTLVRRPLDHAYLAHESERLLAALEAYVAVEPAEPGGALLLDEGQASDACRIPRRRVGGQYRDQGSGGGGRGEAGVAPSPDSWPLVPDPWLARLLEALAAVTGYVAAAGVADGRGAAWIAARRATAGAVVWVPPGETAAYLAPLPAALLPVSAEMRRRLELLGLRTIGALAALPLGAVQAQFGPEGRLAWEIAHGRDRRPLALRTPPCVPSAATSFDAPCADRAQLLAAVEALLDRALEEVPSGQVVGSLHVVLELEGGSPPAPKGGDIGAPPPHPPAFREGRSNWGDTLHPPRQGSTLCTPGEDARGHSRQGGIPCIPAISSSAPGGGGAWVPLVIALHDATAEAGALRRALQTALLRVALLAAVVGVRLELQDLGASTPLQPGLFDARGAAQLALTAATRSLCTRFGANPLQRVVALDPRHRLPERRYALVEAS